MEVIGWIAWGFTALTALVNLVSPSGDVGIRASKIREGIMTSLFCIAVLYFHWNKLLTPIALPISLIISMTILTSRASSAQKKRFAAMNESHQTVVCTP